jgi:hypothetical protein
MATGETRDQENGLRTQLAEIGMSVVLDTTTMLGQVRSNRRDRRMISIVSSAAMMLIARRPVQRLTVD